MADTGRIRCPINLLFSSNTAIRREASVGRTTWREIRVLMPRERFREHVREKINTKMKGERKDLKDA